MPSDYLDYRNNLAFPPQEIKSQDDIKHEARSSDVLYKPNGDLTGKRFGRLTVVYLDHKKPRKDGGNILFWFCKCDCGNEVVVRGDNLRSGNTTSCGCFARDNTSNIKKTHGKRNTRLYGVWENIKSRILNKNDEAYPNYGGRGLTICSEWLNDFMSFYNWSVQNGYSENLTIDRINNDKGYYPENCRWVGRHIQSSNRRTPKNNKTGYVGVYFSKCKNSYVSQITINKKTHTLGKFDTIKEALAARNNYIIKNNLFEYKLQDFKECNTMYEDTRSTLALAIEKCEKLEKQLEIAVEALKEIYEDTKGGHIQCDACNYTIECEGCVNQDVAEKALNQIKELDNHG